MRGRLGILQIKEQPTRQNITYAKFNNGIRRYMDSHRGCQGYVIRYNDKKSLSK